MTYNVVPPYALTGHNHHHRAAMAEARLQGECPGYNWRCVARSALIRTQ